MTSIDTLKRYLGNCILTDHEVSPGAKVLYEILGHRERLYWTDTDGYGQLKTDPSIPRTITNEDLASLMGRSVPAIRKYIKELKDRGYVTTRVFNSGTEFTLAKGSTPHK